MDNELVFLVLFILSLINGCVILENQRLIKKQVEEIRSKIKDLEK